MDLLRFQRANITHFIRNMDLPSDNSDFEFTFAREEGASSEGSASDTKSGTLRSTLSITVLVMVVFVSCVFVDGCLNIALHPITCTVPMWVT